MDNEPTHHQPTHPGAKRVQVNSPESEDKDDPDWISVNPWVKRRSIMRSKLTNEHPNAIREKRRVKMKLDPTPRANDRDANGVPRTIASHTHLLELSDPDGSRLRSYYKLSVDELFGFPPTPTDEEYCTRLNIPGMTPRMIPGTHLAALSAARFAEVALGAIVHNEVALGMELCNAVVHCLRESVQEPVQSPYMFEVARSYFLLGVFRAFRGDMVRYFKYRRVCLTYISKLDVSFLSSWFASSNISLLNSSFLCKLLCRTMLVLPLSCLQYHSSMLGLT